MGLAYENANFMKYLGENTFYITVLQLPWTLTIFECGAKLV